MSCHLKIHICVNTADNSPVVLLTSMTDETLLPPTRFEAIQPGFNRLCALPRLKSLSGSWSLFGVTPALPEQWAAAGQRDAFVEEQPAGSAGIQPPPGFSLKRFGRRVLRGRGPRCAPRQATRFHGVVLWARHSPWTSTARGHPQPVDIQSSIASLLRKKQNKYDASYKYT